MDNWCMGTPPAAARLRILTGARTGKPLAEDSKIGADRLRYNPPVPAGQDGQAAAGAWLLPRECGPPAPLESLVPMENHMLQSCWVSAGDAAWPDARRDRIEEQIIRAYVHLVFATEADGSRTVTVSRQGSLEVRLTEMPRPGLPTFWLEIHSLGTRSIIDSLGCFEFDEDELAAAVDFICEAQERHQTWH